MRPCDQPVSEIKLAAAPCRNGSIAAGSPSCDPPAETRRRFVLIGASNLSIMFPIVAETIRAAFASPVELFVAKGPGRSWSFDSGFLGKKFPKIFDCAIWGVLDSAPPCETSAVIADAGNDLGYGADPDDVAALLEAAVDRLRAHGAQVALGGMPTDALERVGPARYALLRRLFFPRSTLPRTVLLQRAARLQAALEQIAKIREIPLISAEAAWYGWDPIHPRRRHAATPWQRLIAAASGLDAPPRIVVPSWRRRAQWRRLEVASLCLCSAADVAHHGALASDAALRVRCF